MDIICDIDGTIADLSHRRHYVTTKPKNWDAFHAACAFDKPIEPVIGIIRQARAKGRVVLCSGRPETSRDATEKWLHAHKVWHDALYMRPAGDFRSDDVIKEELLDRILADGFEPEIVFDDRQRVVDMWRRRGLICAQVAPGDF